jgi:hypothetical protein
MKGNEDDTNTAYDRADRHGGKTPAVAELLSQNLEDERRHPARIEEALARMEAGLTATKDQP